MTDRTTCADCGAPLPDHHASTPGLPEHVDRCCDCADEALNEALARYE